MVDPTIRPQSAPVLTTKTVPAVDQPSPRNPRLVPLLLGAIVILLVVIGVLLAVFITNNPGAYNVNITPTPALAAVTPTETVFEPSVLPTPTSAPGVTVTTAPAITWKDFSYVVKNGYYGQDFTLTGKYPADTVINSKGPETGGVNFSNNKYLLSILFSPGGEAIHYVSFKTLPKHAQFGDIIRVRYNDNTNMASYVSGPATTSGYCELLGDKISTPCGADSIGGDSFILNVDCTASLTYRNSICDVIVNSLRIK
jgi:hypothetical protein